MEEALPDGWTLDRVREVAKDSAAKFESDDVRVLIESYPHGNNVEVELEPVEASVILRFHDLALVRPKGEDDWYMGQRLGQEIRCWASYGPDLEAAIRGL